MTTAKEFLNHPTKGIPPVEIEPVTMTADKITLYRSDRGKSGMIYTEIAYVDAG